MINRIELILKTQNLTPTQFADAIGIQRSSMSHILARRNNPSLDFVMKVLNRFPEINAEWLLTGKNQMLSMGTSHPAPTSTQTSQINLQAPEFEWDDKFESAPADTSTSSVSNAVAEPVEATDNHKKIPTTSNRESNQNSDIERIIVFFTDGTFKSYA